MAIDIQLVSNLNNTKKQFWQNNDKNPNNRISLEQSFIWNKLK